MSEYCKCCGQKYNDARSLLANSCSHHPEGRDESAFHEDDQCDDKNDDQGLGEAHEEFRRKVIGGLDVEKDCEVIAHRAACAVCEALAKFKEGFVASGDERERELLDKAKEGGAKEQYEYADYISHVCDRSDWDVVDEKLCCAAMFWYASAAKDGHFRAMRELGEAFHGCGVDMYGEGYFSEDESALIPIDEEISFACHLVAERLGDACSARRVFMHYLADRYDVAIEIAGRFSALPYKECEPNEKWDDYQDRLYIKMLQSEVDLVLGKGEPIDPARWKPWERPYAFAVCHENGWRIEKDIDKALEYYRKAFENGCVKAADAIARLEKVKSTC